MSPAIRVENLSKQYRLGCSQGSYRTIRESLSDVGRGAWNRLRGKRASCQPMTDQGRNAIWALKDVSFEVQPGEVVGIIGRNGAGKSTLLKILSRITEPTHGRVELRGRVGTLLEVGTGFHPELTGRENIYMNGAILGMSRAEISRKFDEIIDFAEIEGFLDTPVKRYSSGMYVRLAFAVAAHLEPEILIIDEVLAVGDIEFQRKCLAKMDTIAQHGRTVFFVSHNADAVQRLCRRAIVLSHGCLEADGLPSHLLNQYLADRSGFNSAGEWICLEGVSRRGSGLARFLSLRCQGDDADAPERIASHRGVKIDVCIESNISRTVPRLAVTFYHRLGTKLVNADTIQINRSLSLRKGRNTFQVAIDHLFLTPGEYSVGLWLATPPEVFDHIDNAATVQVVHMSAHGLERQWSCEAAVPCTFNLRELPV